MTPGSGVQYELSAEYLALDSGRASTLHVKTESGPFSFDSSKCVGTRLEERKATMRTFPGGRNLLTCWVFDLKIGGWECWMLNLKL